MLQDQRLGLLAVDRLKNSSYHKRQTFKTISLSLIRNKVHTQHENICFNIPGNNEMPHNTRQIILYHAKSSLLACSDLSICMSMPVCLYVHIFKKQKRLMETNNSHDCYRLKHLPAVLWHCWLSGRKGSWPEKSGGGGGGGHRLVEMEWRPAGWSMCLPLLIFPCTIKSRSSLLTSDTDSPGWSRKKGRKTFVVWWWCVTDWNSRVTTITTTTTLHPSNGLCSRTTWVSQHQKGKPFWILLE